MNRKLFGFVGALVVLLALGLVLAGCDMSGWGDWSTPSVKIVLGSDYDANTAITTAKTGTELRAYDTGFYDFVSYQWKKDGGTISDAIYRTYTPTEAGTYTVEATGFKYRESNTGGGRDTEKVTVTSQTVTVTAQ